MKILAGIGLAALIVASNASATTIAVVQSAVYSATTPGASITPGSLSFAQLNLTPLSTITGVTLIYETDYSGAIGEPLQIVSTFSPNGSGMVSDTLTTNYVTSSTESYLDSASLTFTQEPIGTTASNGVPIASGFFQTVPNGLGGSVYGSFAVAYTSTVTSGTASGATVLAEVLYTYTTSSAGGTPEPVSMILFGSGLLAVSLVGRKKFFARK